MRTMRPMPLKESYYLPIMREIAAIFYDVLYKPLIEDVREYSDLKVSLSNASDPLADALASGRVWYEDGAVRGDFNAAISHKLRSIGAVYDRRSKSWRIEQDKIGVTYSSSMAMAQTRYAALQQQMLMTIDKMGIASIDVVARAKDKYKQTIEWIGDDWDKAIKGVTISPHLTEEGEQAFAERYANDLSKFIKGWTDEEIGKLRNLVADNQGRRAESLAKIIEERYSVSQRKAKFLARQETTLMMSEYKIQRGKMAGSPGYIWRGAMDERERQSHRALEGKFISWDNPPIVEPNGRRAHAGEDFGCRCTMVITFKTEDET